MDKIIYSSGEVDVSVADDRILVHESGGIDCGLADVPLSEAREVAAAILDAVAILEKARGK
jgi:hypothetical protein